MMAKIRMRGRYRYRNGKRIHVKGHLRKDTGRPGRTPNANAQNWLTLQHFFQPGAA